VLELEQKIERLAEWIAESEYLVVFTGAGISTESGIRDFRGPDGLWTRRDKGLATPEQNWLGVEPNAGHHAITALQEMGKMAFLISQNIDNLHLKAGINPEILAELHGNLTRVRCLQCGMKMDRADGETNCPVCGGKLKSSVVDFGDSLPVKDLQDSYKHAKKSDLFLVVGSSLVVYPAADIPAVALASGARLVIINRGETPLDSKASLLFEEKIGDVLSAVVEKVKKKLKQN
jgi:NAD-dependent deacetylase